jgi:hypothetical protein
VDPLAFALAIAVSVLGGAIVGWFGHIFAQDRSSNERRIVDATERIDRCSAMVAARVAYAAAWHRGDTSWHALKKERLALERRQPNDVPDIVLGGTEEWAEYLETEKLLRHDTTTSREQRATQIEASGAAVLRMFSGMRATVRA